MSTQRLLPALPALLEPLMQGRVSAPGQQQLDKWAGSSVMCPVTLSALFGGGHFLLNSYIICRSWNALFWLLLTDKTVYKEFFPTAAVWHQHSKFNSSPKSHKTSRPCLVCFRQQLHTRREQSCRLWAPDVWVKPPSGYSAGKTNATFRKTISRKTETDWRGEATSGAAGCKSGWAASRHWHLNQLLLIH